MIEVEAKIAVENLKELKDIRKKASEIGKYEGIKNKKDYYYTLEDLKHGKYPHKSIRIRRIGRLWQINSKKRLSYVKGIYAKDESEFSINDSSKIKFVNLIMKDGYRMWLVKEKRSEIYEIKKNFHVEINNVKGLGWFVEIEYLSDMKGINLARKEIDRVMKSMKIDKKRIVKDGYTKMLWDRRINGR